MPPTSCSPPFAFRRRCLARGAAGLALLALAGCASLLEREPVRVNVVGIDPLPGEGLEARLALKLRVINPNDTPITFDGISVSLEVRGQHFASGVSDERGEVPRFGEAILTVPVSVSAFALAKQAMGMARGGSPRIDYVLKGRLAGTALGGVGFRSSGEVDWPAELGGR